MKLFLTIFLTSCSYPIFAVSRRQGAAWTEGETLVIYKKVSNLFDNPGSYKNQYEENQPDHPDFHPKTTPNAQKVIHSFIICHHSWETVIQIQPK